MEEKSIKLLVEELFSSAKERIEAASILMENSKLIDAVNRIYFGVFHATKGLLLSYGKDPKTHGGLMAEFGLHIIKQGLMPKKYATILRKTMEARESGDYTILAMFEKNDVESLLRDAKDFISEAEKVAGKRIKEYQ